VPAGWANNFCLGGQDLPGKDTHLGDRLRRGLCKKHQTPGPLLGISGYRLRHRTQDFTGEREARFPFVMVADRDHGKVLTHVEYPPARRSLARIEATAGRAATSAGSALPSLPRGQVVSVRTTSSKWSLIFVTISSKRPCLALPSRQYAPMHGCELP
jgi:hypothetical protein